MKRKLSEYFTYEGFKYVFTTVLIILFWMWVTPVIVKPNRSEVLRVFIQNRDVLELDLYNQFETVEGVKLVDIIYLDPNNPNYDALIEVQAWLDTDVIILNKEDIQTAHIKHYAWSIETTVFEGLNLSYYEIESVIYGINLDDYVLFFNEKSVNIGLNHPNQTRAIQAVKRLLEGML